jgi:hypothetical protein
VAQFFGGTVNVKYLSVLFVGDDAFDSDEGYQGKGQFLFAMTGAQGNHGTEMDSKTNGNFDSMPRSHPAFYSMTIIGGGAGGRGGGLMRLREGTGGKFGNVILTNPTDIGVRIGDCGSEPVSQSLPPSGTSLGMSGEAASSGYLYFSSNNIVSGAITPLRMDCTGKALTAANFVYDSSDALLSGGDFSESSAVPVDPRPACGGPAWSGIDAAPHSDAFYDTVTYKGAFGTDNWLASALTSACTRRPLTHASPFTLLLASQELTRCCRCGCRSLLQAGRS